MHTNILSKMPQIEEGFKDVVYKLAIYIPGVILGLAAKLSKIRKHRKLTWREGIFQTTVAFSSAWLVYWALAKWWHVDVETAAVASVVCGRFGDEIINWVGAYLKRWAKLTLESIK